MILSHLFLLILIAASPSNGATPANTARPPIPRAMIMRAIRSDLVYNAPHLEIDLDAATPSPAIANFVRAKLLRVTGKSDGYRLEPKGRLVLMLTAKGERIALRRGWAFGGGLLQIPTGRLSYVDGSYSVQRKESRAYITYLWRFEGNGNLAYLLRLGAPSTWPASMLTSCLRRGGLKHGPPQSRKIEIGRSSPGNWSRFPEIAGIQGCPAGK